MIENPGIGVINRPNGCGTTLFKKGLTENGGFDFKRLIPQTLSGVVNRPNGCGTTVAAFPRRSCIGSKRVSLLPIRWDLIPSYF
ncbi:MAG: hypothetical protein PHQ15_06080 [Methanosarcina sp.]|nr:hypothetical protein [Methanosarcina sp.]MDD3317138.1 hypothetical protein [Methanosarcina sp.]MDD4620374.1 hypothetical protein [Methanosarcina sp.]NLN43094.1 hypothetical protein [Methanosarcina sp.]